MTRIRLVPVILIALISFVVLSGGWWAYRQYNVVNPLKDSLGHISGVQSVQVDTGNPNVITITLGRVSDLQSTYQTISKAVRSVLGDPQSVTVNIQDNRNQDLNDVYEALVPVLQQGIAHGSFTDMISATQQKAKQMHADARITMDEHNIYIQLEEGSHYLYQVMPYTLLRQGGGAS
ncbi:hypothetical protein [Alicyclobacillus pomorum]|uniref:hypothetical protein n=1 Tax=Alicyclobacillus pomorum TaxID=204470 RepID=UPI000426C6D3|nr:hypothetical protein [Alicyclobacillus pomorum]